MIEVISGTNRPGSNTLKVAKIVLELYRQQGQEAQILDLQDLPGDIFDPSSYAQKPASFAPFQDRILQAAGLHVVIPEYNGSFPGIMKYFIDMLKFPESFEHRCVTYTGHGAGIWGSFRGVEQLQMIFGYRNGYNLPERTWMPKINEKLSEDGTRITDEQAAKSLQNQVIQFIDFVKRNGHLAARAVKKG